MALPIAPDDRRITRWLYVVALITYGLIVFGGFVRLTRSGLSIVEWNPVMGTLPPLSDAAWASEFAKYQQSPEYKSVNATMTMDGYQRIYYIEWAHRLIARVAGLAVVLPLIVFWWRGVISRRRAGTFLAIGLLFGFQGFIGWFMVRSGLFERPEVSHYRLTIHLLTASLLLAVIVWSMLDGNASVRRRTRAIGSTPASRFALAVLAIVVLQVAYGGLVAGLKAGHVSYTWPLIGGQWLPTGMFASGVNWDTLTEAPASVHWIHRWFAFAAAAAVVALLFRIRRAPERQSSRDAAIVAVALVTVQVMLGITMLLHQMPLTLALLHQALGLAVFVAVVVTNHCVLREA